MHPTSPLPEEGQTIIPLTLLHYTVLYSTSLTLAHDCPVNLRANRRHVERPTLGLPMVRHSGFQRSQCSTRIRTSAAGISPHLTMGGIVNLRAPHKPETRLRVQGSFTAEAGLSWSDRSPALRPLKTKHGLRLVAITNQDVGLASVVWCGTKVVVTRLI